MHNTKTVSVRGVRFKIRKIDVSNHMEGLKVLMKTYQTYEEKVASEKKLPSDGSLEKMKDVYSDIFVTAVVHPKLVRSPDQPGQLVDELFCDWDFCHKLYEQIMTYTYGKKKLKGRRLQRAI